MGEFLAIMLSIMFYVTPKDVVRVQIWAYAGDTNQHTNELGLSFRRTETGWCPEAGETNQARCISISDGNWVDERGKILLEIKSNLKVTNGTNYVSKPKDWENPLEFSIAARKGERTFAIKSKGETVREFRVKPLKSNNRAQELCGET